MCKNEELKIMENSKRKMNRKLISKKCENCRKKPAVKYIEYWGIYPEDKDGGGVSVCVDCKKWKLCGLCGQQLIKKGDICYSCWDHNEEIVKEQGLKYVE
jgi:hypothetical protein